MKHPLFLPEPGSKAKCEFSMHQHPPMGCFNHGPYKLKATIVKREKKGKELLWCHFGQCEQTMSRAPYLPQKDSWLFYVSCYVSLI